MQLIAMVVLLGFLGFIITKAVEKDFISIALTVGKSLPLKSILGFFVGGISLPFLSVDLWQRIYAAKDVKTVQRSLIFSAFIYFFIGFFLVPRIRCLSKLCKNQGRYFLYEQMITFDIYIELIIAFFSMREPVLTVDKRL